MCQVGLGSEQSRHCGSLPRSAHYVYKLLCAKYCYSERDTSKAKKAEMDEGMYLIALSLIESGDLNPEQAGQTAKAICHKFVSANRCQCCGGAERSGSIKRAGISSSARSAAGLGVTLKAR